MKKILVVVSTSILFLCFAQAPHANSPSKRIEVYAISQNFWDVTPGETLGMIVKELLPDNPDMRQTLMSEIIKLNPDAFSKSNPDNLKANIRLWLPNSAPTTQSQIDKKKYHVKSFSWGQLHTPKRD